MTTVMSPPADIEMEFVLDDAGKPKSIQKRRKHYYIRAHIENVPNDVYAVTYLLDPSFASPMREIRDKANSFPLTIATYGNFILQAEIRGMDGTRRTGRSIEKALKARYYDSTDSDIRKAIEDISNN